MRYKADWLITQQILALTHFDSVVTPDDFAGIASDTARAIEDVENTFHVLIDNRIIESTNIAPLDLMLQAMPVMNHPQLRWIVVILPEHIKEQAQELEIQKAGDIQLRYVDSLETAYQHLRDVDNTLTWDAIDTEFFISK